MTDDERDRIVTRHLRRHHADRLAVLLQVDPPDGEVDAPLSWWTIGGRALTDRELRHLASATPEDWHTVAELLHAMRDVVRDMAETWMGEL